MTRKYVGLTLAVAAAAAALAVGIADADGGGVRTERSSQRLGDIPSCKSSIDVYDYTPAALRKCGYRVYPLSYVRALPGGGHEYVYREGRSTVSDLVPPSGFVPAQASNAQLREYGFPTRPSRPSALRHWMIEMKSWKRSAPPEPFQVVDPYLQFGIGAGSGALNQAGGS